METRLNHSLQALLTLALFMMAGCSAPPDPPLVFYVKDLKLAFVGQAATVLEQGYRRSFAQHLSRKNPLTSLDGVPEQDLVAVRVDTGFTYQQTINLLRARDGGVVVVQQGGDRYALDTPAHLLKLQKLANGYNVIAVLDKARGIGIDTTRFFMTLE